MAKLSKTATLLFWGSGATGLSLVSYGLYLLHPAAGFIGLGLSITVFFLLMAVIIYGENNKPTIPTVASPRPNRSREVN